jgi:hypothetical protein
MNQGLELIKEKGPEAVKEIYPDVDFDTQQIYNSLPTSLNHVFISRVTGSSWNWVFLA